MSPTTYQRYASIVKLHLKPHLGALSLPRLSGGNIATAYGKVRAKRLSGQSCLHTHRVLHTALQYGTKTLGWLRANPAAAVRSPKVTRKTAALGGNTVSILLTLKNGTSVNEVSQLLGHSSPVITLSTYAHVIEGVAREAVNVLANSLISRPTGTDGA